MGFIGTCNGYTGGLRQENDSAEFGMARQVHVCPVQLLVQVMPGLYHSKIATSASQKSWLWRSLFFGGGEI